MVHQGNLQVIWFVSSSVHNSTLHIPPPPKFHIPSTSLQREGVGGYKQTKKLRDWLPNDGGNLFLVESHQADSGCSGWLFLLPSFHLHLALLPWSKGYQCRDHLGHKITMLNATGVAKNSMADLGTKPLNPLTVVVSF